MAQTNFTPISLYYSTTAAAVPTAGNLVAGELAINTQDGKLFYKDAAGVVQTIASKAGALGDVVGPASATDNAVARFDATTGKLIQNSLVTVSDTGAISAPVDASISGLTVGKGGGAVANNTAVGASALSGSNTGDFNTAVGGATLSGNTSGESNTAIGRASLNANTTGSSNSGLGRNSLINNTTGSFNTAVGRDSLLSNTTASFNTAVGYQAGYNGTTADQSAYLGFQAGYAGSPSSVAVGSQALESATNGSHVAVGESALTANTTGVENTAVGRRALYSNTTGGQNTSLGMYSLYSNTTASNNTAVGFQAGYSNTTGIRSTLIGTEAGYSANPSSSVGNTLVGWQAGYNSTGNGNTFIGVNGTDAAVGWRMTTGSKNTIIGGYSGNQGGLDIRTASNYIVLSDGDGNPRLYSDPNGKWTWIKPVTGTDQIGYLMTNNDGTFYLAKDSSTGGSFGLGNYANVIYSSAKSIYVQAQSGGVYVATGGTSWTSASDERLKENLVPITDAANKVSSLRAVTGNLIADETKKSRAFLIAQDVQAVLPEAVDATNPDKLGVQYTDLIPLLVAAVKELKAEIDQLKGK